MASFTFPPAGLIRAPTTTASTASDQPERTASTGLLQQPPQQSPIYNLAAAVPASASASPSLQNPRVAHLQFAAGTGISSTTTTSALPHRFTPSQNHFYASSAPPSTVALNFQQQRVSAVRPPVPTFPYSTGSVPQIPAKMVLEDLQGLSDFAAAGYEGATFSPAMAAGYDLHSSVSSSSVSNLGTVSPNDLFLQDSFVSAPNSNALTDLTSPSDFDGSPYDSFDVSPNFAGNDYDGASHDTWFPLFAQDTNAASVGLAAGDVPTSPAANPAEDGGSGTSSSRRKSGHSRSTSTSAKHSSTAGVGATPRRREKPLPPIIVDDPNDTVAMKRARNTLAARKSRERKAMRMDELEEKIAKLEEERDHWKKIALSRKG
ncbi:bZIP transcription factor, bZIP-1 [Niveomyces insectorum RCEF 264]|uniref:Cross-pathway control protein 1 n=1 Tax=Niveomyces insectorum RCEF 264 TaxID=1081102 RepID=A0A167XUK6_9HYPO|nr:bZIP transcription factor, bZIP-1 [Niveomyces insectorum RCEF 264]